MSFNRKIEIINELLLQINKSSELCELELEDTHIIFIKELSDWYEQALLAGKEKQNELTAALFQLLIKIIDNTELFSLFNMHVSRQLPQIFSREEFNQYRCLLDFSTQEKLAKDQNFLIETWWTEEIESQKKVSSVGFFSHVKSKLLDINLLDKINKSLPSRDLLSVVPALPTKNLISKEDIQQLSKSALVELFNRGDDTAISFQLRFVRKYLDNPNHLAPSPDIFLAGLQNTHNLDPHFKLLCLIAFNQSQPVPNQEWMAGLEKSLDKLLTEGLTHYHYRVLASVQELGNIIPAETLKKIANFYQRDFDEKIKKEMDPELITFQEEYSNAPPTALKICLFILNLLEKPLTVLEVYFNRLAPDGFNTRRVMDLALEKAWYMTDAETASAIVKKIHCTYLINLTRSNLLSMQQKRFIVDNLLERLFQLYHRKYKKEINKDSEARYNLRKINEDFDAILQAVQGCLSPHYLPDVLYIFTHWPQSLNASFKNGSSLIKALLALGSESPALLPRTIILLTREITKSHFFYFPWVINALTKWRSAVISNEIQIIIDEKLLAVKQNYKQYMQNSNYRRSYHTTGIGSYYYWFNTNLAAYFRELFHAASCHDVATQEILEFVNLLLNESNTSNAANFFARGGLANYFIVHAAKELIKFVQQTPKIDPTCREKILKFALNLFLTMPAANELIVTNILLLFPLVEVEEWVIRIEIFTGLADYRGSYSLGTEIFIKKFNKILYSPTTDKEILARWQELIVRLQQTNIKNIFARTLVFAFRQFIETRNYNLPMSYLNFTSEYPGKIYHLLIDRFKQLQNHDIEIEESSTVGNKREREDEEDASEHSQKRMRP